MRFSTDFFQKPGYQRRKRPWELDRIFRKALDSMSQKAGNYKRAMQKWTADAVQSLVPDIIAEIHTIFVLVFVGFFIRR
jgi:hypothetical protein